MEFVRLWVAKRTIIELDFPLKLILFVTLDPRFMESHGYVKRYTECMAKLKLKV